MSLPQQFNPAMERNIVNHRTDLRLGEYIKVHGVGCYFAGEDCRGLPLVEYPRSGSKPSEFKTTWPCFIKKLESPLATGPHE
jgi:hypothetical protein